VENAFPMPRTLTREEIQEKLNEIPVFSVVDAQENIVPTLVERGEPASLVYYIDLNEAHAVLAELRVQHPGHNLTIGIDPLGTVFALTKEWVDSGAPSDAPKLHIQAPRGAIATSKMGPCPLFFSREFELTAGTPIFVRRADLLSLWVTLGRPADKPPVIVVTELSALVVAMETEDQQVNWERMRLYPSPDSIEYVEGHKQRIQGDAAPATPQAAAPSQAAALPPRPALSGDAPAAAEANEDKPTPNARKQPGSRSDKQPSARRPPLPPSPTQA